MSAHQLDYLLYPDVATRRHSKEKTVTNQFYTCVGLISPLPTDVCVS